MPYTKNGKRYDRITEIVSSGDCKRLMYNNKNLSPNRPKRVGLIALTGTLLHQAIEKHEITLMDNPYDMALSLDESEKRILAKLRREDKRIRERTPDQVSAYAEMQTQVQLMYGNYLQFVIDNPHKPFAVEKQFFDDKQLIGGTVDLLMIKEMTGEKVMKKAHEGMPAKRYFIEKEGGKDTKMVLTVTDWKSSKRKQPGHMIQMSGYHYMLENVGFFDKIRALGYEINLDTWSVLFGLYKPTKKLLSEYNGAPPKYQLFKYSSDSTDFLVRENIRHENLTELTVDMEGKNGLKGHCLFCSDVLNCSQWQYTSFDYDTKSENIVIIEPFSKKELSYLTLLLRKQNLPKFAQEIPSKLKRILSENTEDQKWMTDKIIAELYNGLGMF